jgi:Cu-Zn family superoxide dismutase
MKTMFSVGIRCSAVLAAALTLVGCGSETQATAPLAATEAVADNKTAGTATFTQQDDTVELVLEVTGATPGKHGAHIHENGDCGNNATNAGGHWNPTTSNHGAPDAAAHHLGDLGNIEIGADGKGKLTISMKDWKIGDGSATDIVGKAVVIHGGEDDLTSQPAGNSGARVACGVIAKKAE